MPQMAPHAWLCYLLLIFTVVSVVVTKLYFSGIKHLPSSPQSKSIFSLLYKW